MAMDDVAAFERRLTRTAELPRRNRGVSGVGGDLSAHRAPTDVPIGRSRPCGRRRGCSRAAALAGGAGRLGRGGRARCPHRSRRAPRGLAIPGRAVRQGRRGGPPQRQLQHRFGAARALLGVLHRTHSGWPVESGAVRAARGRRRHRHPTGQGSVRVRRDGEVPSHGRDGHGHCAPAEHRARRAPPRHRRAVHRAPRREPRG